MTLSKLPDCRFRVDPSGLYRNCEIRLLKADNQFYQARFYYMGDYAADLAADKLNRRLLTVSVRLIKPGFELKLLGRDMAVQVNDTFCSSRPLNQIYTQFYAARRSAKLLDKIFNKYFPQPAQPVF